MCGCDEEDPAAARRREAALRREAEERAPQPSVRIVGKKYEGEQPDREIEHILPLWAVSLHEGALDASVNGQLAQLEEYLQLGVLSETEFEDARQRVLQAPEEQEMTRADSARKSKALSSQPAFQGTLFTSRTLFAAPSSASQMGSRPNSQQVAHFHGDRPDFIDDDDIDEEDDEDEEEEEDPDALREDVEDDRGSLDDYYDAEAAQIVEQQREYEREPDSENDDVSHDGESEEDRASFDRAEKRDDFEETYSDGGDPKDAQDDASICGGMHREAEEEDIEDEEDEDGEEEDYDARKVDIEEDRQSRSLLRVADAMGESLHGGDDELYRVASGENDDYEDIDGDADYEGDGRDPYWSRTVDKINEADIIDELEAFPDYFQ